MNKLVIVSGIGIVIGASGTGITALTGGFSNFSKPHKNIPKITSSKEITTTYKQLPCSSELFKGEVDWKISSSDEELALNETEHDLQMTSESLGCIAVWWNKEHHGDSWKGNWNVLWSMRDGNYGLIFISTAIADKGKVEVEGSFYIVKEIDNIWTVIGKKTGIKQEVNASNVEKLIVKPGDTLVGDRDGWNFDFISSSICSTTNQCNNKKPVNTSAVLTWDYLRESWPINSENYQEATKWSKNIDIWESKEGLLGEEIQQYYENTGGYFKLREY